MNHSSASFLQRVVGIDIGGANIKLALWLSPNLAPHCSAQPFALWKHPDELGKTVAASIAQLLSTVPKSYSDIDAGPPDRLAVTMTGELADCYATRAEGVARILEQLRLVMPSEQIDVYAVGEQWLTPSEAVDDPWRVAASNWHALATWLGRWNEDVRLSPQAVLVDIGSTTVDIIPMRGGCCASDAQTDRQRLVRSQLVYTGMARTPICAITSHLELRGESVPVMAEWFATSDDAYLALSLVEEDPLDRATADQRPRTAVCARARLARMVGEDDQTLTVDELNHIAHQIVDSQARSVAGAIDENLQWLAKHNDIIPTQARLPRLISTGHGGPLLERACRYIKTPHVEPVPAWQCDSLAMRCAPAVAVAYLRASTNRSAR